MNNLDVSTSTPKFSLKLKEKAIVPDNIGAMVCDLVAQGLKVAQVRNTIFTVAQAMGMTVEGNISERTIRRIIQEGWVAAVMQIVEEINSAEGNVLQYLTK